MCKKRPRRDRFECMKSVRGYIDTEGGEESHRGTERCQVEEQGADHQESLEEQQHRMFNSTRSLKKPGRLQQKKPQVRQAAKEVAERKAKARQQTRQKALAKTLQRQRTGTEEQLSERDCRQHAE